MPAPVPEPSFVDELLNNPLVLPGLGALLVALGGLGIYNARRKKKSKGFDDSIITDSNLKANSLFGSTGGQSVDTNNRVFNSSFSPSILRDGRDLIFTPAAAGTSRSPPGRAIWKKRNSARS